MSEQININAQHPFPLLHDTSVEQPISTNTKQKAELLMQNGGTSLREVSDQLVERFPTLSIESISFLGEGLDNRAYLLNGSHVFRIPKNKENAQQRGEINLMPLLKRHVRFGVPNYTHVSKGTEPAQSWVTGCEVFTGEQLSVGKYHSLSRDQKENVLSDAATFLHEIHSVPLDEARKCEGIYDTDDKGMYAWYEDEFFPKNILPSLSEEERQKVTQLLKGYLDDSKNFTHEPVLLHGDAKLEHLFVDPDTGHLQGSIDFAPMIGDPDSDFTRFCGELDPKSFQRLLTLYGHPQPKRCIEKQRVFLLCRYAQKAHDFHSTGKEAESLKEWEKLRAVISTIDKSS